MTQEQEVCVVEAPRRVSYLSRKDSFKLSEQLGEERLGNLSRLFEKPSRRAHLRGYIDVLSETSGRERRQAWFLTPGALYKSAVEPIGSNR